MTKISRETKKEKKKRSARSKYVKYSEESLLAALKAVSKGMSVRRASSKYKVPFSTIRLKNLGLCPIGKRSGPPSVLTSDEEARLVGWIKTAESRGFLLTTNSLLDSVKLLVKQCKRKNSFNNDRPGVRWYKQFLQRHVELADMIAHNKRQKDVPATEKALREWFEITKSGRLEPDNLVDLDPRSIFSCNEIAFFLNPDDDKFILNKTLGLYNLNDSSRQECLVTMFTGNAAGQMLPPIIMFANQETLNEAAEKVPKNWNTGLSESGWMTGDSFYEYVSDVFYPWCLENHIKFPIVMYVSEHSSYYTMALDDFCASHQIKLVSLYTNSLRINPMNVALFWPLKKTWQEVMSSWKIIHGSDDVKKINFAPILKVALESIDIEKYLKNGFSSCGLSPFSADVINYEKLFDFGQMIYCRTFHQQLAKGGKVKEHESTVDSKMENIKKSMKELKKKMVKLEQCLSEMS